MGGSSCWRVLCTSLVVLVAVVSGGDSKKKQNSYEYCPTATNVTAITIYGNEYVDYQHYLVSQSEKRVHPQSMVSSVSQNAK